MPPLISKGLGGYQDLSFLGHSDNSPEEAPSPCGGTCRSDCASLTHSHKTSVSGLITEGFGFLTENL